MGAVLSDEAAALWEHIERLEEENKHLSQRLAALEPIPTSSPPGKPWVKPHPHAIADRMMQSVDIGRTIAEGRATVGNPDKLWNNGGR